jgi:hypothetical protein
MHACPWIDGRHDVPPVPHWLADVHAIVQNQACAGTLKSAVQTATAPSSPAFAH